MSRYTNINVCCILLLILSFTFASSINILFAFERYSLRCKRKQAALSFDRPSSSSCRYSCEWNCGNLLTANDVGLNWLIWLPLSIGDRMDDEWKLPTRYHVSPLCVYRFDWFRATFAYHIKISLIAMNTHTTLIDVTAAHRLNPIGANCRERLLAIVLTYTRASVKLSHEFKRSRNRIDVQIKAHVKAIYFSFLLNCSSKIRAAASLESPFSHACGSTTWAFECDAWHTSKPMKVNRNRNRLFFSTLFALIRPVCKVIIKIAIGSWLQWLPLLVLKEQKNKTAKICGFTALQHFQFHRSFMSLSFLDKIVFPKDSEKYNPIWEFR